MKSAKTASFGNALAAIELGKGDKAFVEKIMGNTATLLVAMGVLAAIVGTFLIDPLLVLLGAGGELWQPTKVFLQIVLIGFVLQSLGMGMNNFLRTAGPTSRLPPVCWEPLPA